ncbi:alcohol dehydrogenase catalytic domain-containing protein [Actinomadura syzygii]|uniref:Alcohol dehydrogenase catalytic domain-containing protein n=2 Tax=Actinomadura syzygii TaxID=1427538 RepID=A0A5D0TR27_9ACTN|nr:alcohol dehydrogenase catalytic domain-containing protein [Actinomadura syzygii]
MPCYIRRVMKALVFTAPSVVELQDIDEPSVRSGETLVAVAAAGICGSELHGVRTPGFRTPPLVMGHEFAGTLPDGRRVVVNPILSCGVCDLCGRGQRQLCRERALIGVHRPGGFAERVAVPASAVHQLPDGMPWTAAGLIEPIAYALHSWNVAGGPDGARIGVIGCGTIGLLCVQLARLRGAASVVAADVSPRRAAIAARLGADAAGPALTGEFDVVFDAVGLPATRADALARLRPGGIAVALGLASADPGFDAADLVRAEKRLLGSFGYTAAEFAAATDIAAECDLSWVDTFPLADGARVFTELMNGGTEPVKALLTP